MRAHLVFAMAMVMLLAACSGGGSTPNADPVARLTALPASGSAPLSVTFNASASSDADGNIVLYEWDFDADSVLDSGTAVPSETHVYTAVGTYTARLRVIDNGGGSDTVEITINVTTGAGGGNQPPVAALTATPTSGTAPLTVSLDASASSDPDGSIATYEWAKDDAAFTTPGVADIILVVFPEAGTFTATVRVSDNGSPALTATASVTITVTEPATDVNTRARLARADLWDAQAAYFAANGKYAPDLATLHNGGADPSYIDAEMASGDLGDVALRMLWVDDAHFIVTTVAGDTDGPPTPGLAPPHVDFLPTAPNQSFLTDETGTLYDEPLDIAVKTIEAVDASAEAALRRIMEAQDDFHIANSRYAISLAELLSGPGGTQFLDARTANNELPYVRLHNRIGAPDNFAAEAIAGTGVLPFHLYLADRGSFTKTNINEVARMYVEQVLVMQSLYTYINGEPAFFSVELIPYGFPEPRTTANIVVGLIGIDDNHFVVYAHGGPADSDFLPSEPYDLIWADETRTVHEDPASSELLMASWINARARGALEMAVDAQYSFFAVNGRYAFDLQELASPPAFPPNQVRYIHEAIAQPGYEITVAMAGADSTFTAQSVARGGAPPYHSYVTDETGVIVEQ